MDSAESLTPPNRSRRKRPFINSPLNSSSNTSLLENNDDFQERRLRRKSKILINNILSPGGIQASPSRSIHSEKDKTKSSVDLSHAGMTNVQLKEHYANCIKLSSENKINVKNAFGLHLIDYMKDLLKQAQKDETGTNFQVASCTLDAGVKIYAYRVDSVHNEAYKVLGSLGRVVENAENDQDENDGMQDENQSQPNPTKKTKKKSAGKTIETNLKNINCDKIDVDFEADPFFSKIAASCDEAGTKSLVSFHLKSKSDLNDLMLDSLTNVNDIPTATVGETTKDEDMFDLSHLRDMYNKVDFSSMEICPQFSSFKFLGWDKNSQDVGCDVNILDDSFDGDNIHRFDENAPVLPDQMESFDTGGPADYDDDFDQDRNMLDDVKFDGHAASISDGLVAKGSLINTTGSTHLALSLNPSEYSYFSQEILSMWAGPLHWKVKAKSKDKTTHTDTSAKSVTKKVQVRIDFDEEIDLKKHFVTGRASTHLKESTLEKYASQMSVLPADLRYETENLYKLTLRKFVSIKRQVTAKELRNEDDEWYNYDNRNDREGFCPAVDDGYDGDNYDDDDDIGGTPADVTMSDIGASQQAMTFGGESLVVPPNKVRVLDINYAKAAKRIDIKRLKGAMWKMLTDKEADEKENIENNNLPKPRLEEPTKDGAAGDVSGVYTFKSMYDSLPSNISTNMAKNLSSPIAFVCLLYLANEKCLKLTSNEDMSDITIEGGL